MRCCSILDAYWQCLARALARGEGAMRQPRQAPARPSPAKLPAGTVESLLKPENKEKLQAILKYHVLSAKVVAVDAIAAKSAATWQGGSVHITVDDGQVKINDSKVVKADIIASNGVIHVIDTVLLPSN